MVEIKVGMNHWELIGHLHADDWETNFRDVTITKIYRVTEVKGAKIVEFSTTRSWDIEILIIKNDEIKCHIMIYEFHGRRIMFDSVLVVYGHEEIVIVNLDTMEKESIHIR